jgi:hypothetical protein
MALSSIYQEVADAINHHQLGIGAFKDEVQMHQTLIKRMFQGASHLLKLARGDAAL